MLRASPSPVTIQIFRSGRASESPVANVGARPWMRVESIGVHVIRKPAAAPDAGDKDGFAAIGAELGQHLFHLRQDRIIPAARAPADFLVAGIIRGFQNIKGLIGRNAHMVYPPAGSEVVAGASELSGTSPLVAAPASNRARAANDFSDGKRLAAHFVQSLGIHQKSGTKQQPKLAEIQFGNQHMAKRLHELPDPRWQRIEISNMDGRNRQPLGLQAAGSPP